MVTGSQSLHVSCYTCILKLFMCILPWQTYCSKVAKARLCTGRCMAMLQSYPTKAHPYPSLLSALSKSVLLHQTVAIMILGLWTCQDRVDRLVNIHSCLRYTCIYCADSQRGAIIEVPLLLKVVQMLYSHKCGTLWEFLVIFNLVMLIISFMDCKTEIHPLQSIIFLF